MPLREGVGVLPYENPYHPSGAAERRRIVQIIVVNCMWSKNNNENNKMAAMIFVINILLVGFLLMISR